jgi:hypothetical protein
MLLLRINLAVGELLRLMPTYFAVQLFPCELFNVVLQSVLRVAIGRSDRLIYEGKAHEGAFTRGEGNRNLSLGD